MKNKLAIIIPYYKITFFEETMKSVVSQTNKNFTLYIGNDNSPKDPLTVINKYIDSLHIVYEKFANNLGGTDLVKQWDRCISMSQDEEWIMILGDDDVLENNVVEEFYNNLDKLKNDFQLIRLASKQIDENGNPITKLYINPEVELAKDFLFRCYNGDARCTLTEHFFTRKSYNKHGFKSFPVAFGSDNVAWLEFSEMGNVYGINSAFANIRISSENLSAIPGREIGFKRVEAYYLYNRYIVANHYKYLNKSERQFILQKSYSYLRIFNRDFIKATEFILFMIKHIGIKSTLKIIKSNRFRE